MTLPLGQPLGLRGDHVVLADRRDHDVAHLQHPARHRGQHDGEGRKDARARAALEMNAQVQPGDVTSPLKPWPAGSQWCSMAKKSTSMSARKKYGAAWKNIRTGQRAVEPAAVPPAGQDAEPGAEREGDHRRGADQDQRPRDRLVQDLGDRRGVVGEVHSEVEVEDIVPVVQVLRPERALRRRAADHLLKRLIRAGRQVGVLGQDDLGRVTRYRARDEEVEGNRHPRRYQVEGEAAEYERHAFHLPFCHCRR